MGDALRRMGNSSAPIFFNKALSIPLPPNPPYWIRDSIAIAYVNLKNYTSVADQILQKRPNDLNVLGLKGIALLYLNNNKDALAIFNKILTIRKLVWDLDNKGLVVTRLGNYAGAISVLNTALNITQRDAYTYYDKAEALGLDAFHKHNVLELKVALDNIDKALKIDPFDRDAIKIKQSLVEVLSHLGQDK